MPVAAATLGVPCPICLEALDPLKVRHGRICMHADAVREMAKMVHMDAVAVPAYFGSVTCHTWRDSAKSSAIVLTWCKSFGPHACMCKAKFRGGTDFCAGSISYWKGCQC